MSYCKMVIGEVIGDEQLKEFQRIYSEMVLPKLKDEQGFIFAELLIEDGGRMVVSETLWTTREDLLRNHCGGSYRRFVSLTQHLIIGGFVVKHFKQVSVAERAAQGTVYLDLINKNDSLY